MATAVVTGGAGFISSHLVDLLLEQGHEALVIDVFDYPDRRLYRINDHIGNPNFVYGQGDVRFFDAKFPTWEDVDWVFHLAGLADIVPSIESPMEYMAVNVMGTVNVLEAARRAGVKKFVYAASGSCYGDDPPIPTREDAPVRTRYPYALSKHMGERVCMHWHELYGLPVNSLRLFNVYGPRSRTSGAYGAVMGTFLKQKLEGAPLTIVGDGSQKRDFVHVRDVARAFVLAAETPRSGRIWNVGSGRPQCIYDLACLIGGSDYPTEFLPWRPGEPRETRADIGRIQYDLGWSPEVDFEAGIREMVERIEDWRDAPLWTKETIGEATAAWHRHLGKR